MNRSAFVALAALAVAGCATFPQNAGSPADVSTVVNKIKDDLAVYDAYDGTVRDAPAQSTPCAGVVSFSIENVKVSLTTKYDNSTSAKTGLVVPVGTVTIGANAEGSQDSSGTQNITFMLYPKPRPPAPAPKAPAGVDLSKPLDANNYPIAAALQRLRLGLLSSSDDSATCFAYVDPKKPADGEVGTFEFGFAVVNTQSTGADIKLVVFSLGAANTGKREAGNSITVKFKARPGSQGFR